MKNFLKILMVFGMTLVTILPANAWVGPRRPGVGVGRPGAYGVGGWGRVGRPVARPYVGPVVR